MTAAALDLADRYPNIFLEVGRCSLTPKLAVLGFNA
jgi:hypothetical protein